MKTRETMAEVAKRHRDVPGRLRCDRCKKWYMSAPQLAHHKANAARLCKDSA
jgi:hypothetical protein